MDALQDIKRKIIGLKNETIATRADLKFRKLMRAFKSDFDPDQPRDEQGQWTRGGTSRGLADPEQSPSNLYLASYSNMAECNFQYKRDLLQCKMVGLSTCYAQAMVRLVACERGDPIPPLHY